MTLRSLICRRSLAVALALSACGSFAAADENGFDAERFEAAVKMADSRRQDLKVQMEALNAYWDAVNKAVNAQRGAIRNRQLADAVTEIRRATIDANQKLGDAETRLAELRSLQEDRTNLTKGRGVTRAGVRAGWRAALKLHEASIPVVESPVGFKQIGYEERSGRNWIESADAQKASPEDCPADYATAIELFDWASRNNLIPRPGAPPFALVVTLIKESDAVLTKELESTDAMLTEAEARIVALRQTSWNAIDPPAPAK